MPESPASAPAISPATAPEAPATPAPLFKTVASAMPAPEAAPQAPSPAPAAPPSLPPTPQAEPGVYILHASLYVGLIQSGSFAKRLQQAGLPACVRQEARGEGKLRYLVLVGPYY